MSKIIEIVVPDEVDISKVGRLQVEELFDAFGGHVIEIRPQTTPTVVISMDGGLIHDISCDAPLNVLMLNHDMDGVEDERWRLVDGARCTADLSVVAPMTKEALAQLMFQASVQVYDDAGARNDRYTVAFLDEQEPSVYGQQVYTMLAMSEDPFSPLGFCQHTSGMLGEHLGELIPFDQLPKDCQNAVKHHLMPAAEGLK